MRRFMRILLGVFSVACTNHVLAADDWTAIQMLTRGQKVRVESRPGNKMKGEFVSVNESQIVLRTKNGETAIPRSEIRKIGAVKLGREKYGTLGSLAIAGGGVASLALTLGQVNDLSSGRFPKERGVGVDILTVIAPVAGGAALAMMGGYKTVYEAPP